MMLKYLGWYEAADLVMGGMRQAIKEVDVTHDLARLMRREGRDDVTELSYSGFAQAIIDRM